MRFPLAAPAVLLAVSSAAAGAGHKEAAVSLVFDQAFAETHAVASPILTARGLRAVVYVSSGWVGKLGFMTWEQIEELQNRRGWEIGASTINHVLMTELAASEMAWEIGQNKRDLQDHHIHAVSFASPFGDYNNRVLAAIAREFQSHRALEHPMKSLSTRKQDQAEKQKYAHLTPSRQTLNVFPFNRYLLYVRSVSEKTTSQEVKTWLDQARSEQAWLVLVFVERPSAKRLEQAADLVKSSSIPVRTVGEMLNESRPNLLSNPTFAEGLSGWSSEPSAQVVVNAKDHGCWPEAHYAIEMIGGGALASLVSAKVPVQSGRRYAIRGFVNSDELTAGELKVSVEEFDSSGVRLGETPLGPVSNEDVFEAAFVYRPGENRAASARLQIRLEAGAKGRVYLDSFAWSEFAP